jgi:carboxymethylenebutenolidase
MSDIHFPSNGHDAMGYLARPEGDGVHPGVVVIQEWWGLNDHMRDLTERFAKAGYVALTPDLYHGRVVSEPDEARKEAMGLDRARAAKEIDGAVAYLRSLPYVSPKKIGVVGFCMGGGLALWTASRNPDLGAVVAFYGGGGPGAEQFAGKQTAVMNIVGDRDHALNYLQSLNQGLHQYTMPHELVVYPGAEHAFFNDTRPEVYNPSASEDAWKRALAWFEKYLV